MTKPQKQIQPLPDSHQSDPVPSESPAVETRQRLSARLWHFLLLGLLPLLSFAPAIAAGSPAANDTTTETRVRKNFDTNWRFALGHANDPTKDFEYAIGTFSHFAKAGFGAGASSSKFDDSAWQQVDLPHDWAVELPFNESGSASHGYKAIGHDFPANSVGWYRKRFTIPESDFGKRISIAFDGVFRDSVFWINGHYLGRENSGYSDFAYNLTEVLNYGGENVLVVRVDASLEEGWFYEGAGIYRHVWLEKTNPLHFERHGIAITTDLKDGQATVSIQSDITNESRENAAYKMSVAIVDPTGENVANSASEISTLSPNEVDNLKLNLDVQAPRLWSIESPTLYTLIAMLAIDGREADRIEIPFGIRTISIDAKRGFLLNGKPVQLKGTNNHQDHASIGAALPDAMQEWRLRQLKAMGSNAYRVSHHPATPELLAACDRLGMLVIDENRLMGTSSYHFDHLERMIRRDRNHPSVVLWSIGNEEWGIEGSIAGSRVAEAMQDFVKRLDSTRPVSAAISGGWGNGISKAVEVPGVNYLDNLAKAGYDLDSWHEVRPETVLIGTEECAINNTRGIYVDDPDNCHLNAYDWDPSDWGSPVEYAWKQYADTTNRPWLAGVFLWTGFDYRGEPTPFGWPAINSQFGILDTCGFPKDAYYYLKSWWTDEPVLHIFPHWNWTGRESQKIDVWVYSNFEEVELIQDGKSLGRKPMPRNGHLQWSLVYQPGIVEARAYRNGELAQTKQIETTEAPSALKLSTHPALTGADGVTVAVFEVSTVDKQGRHVPDANQLAQFSVEGGRIIGVGNGDPSCHESDKGTERSLFSGYAQVIVKALPGSQQIRLVAVADGLAPAVSVIELNP